MHHVSVRRCRQNDQRELRRQRKRLRDICAAEAADGVSGGSPDAERLLEPDDVEELCRELPRAAIEDLCTEVEGCEGGEEAKRGLLEAALSSVYESRGEVCVRIDTHSCDRSCLFVLRYALADTSARCLAAWARCRSPETSVQQLGCGDIHACQSGSMRECE